jgi:hypothetical protein
MGWSEREIERQNVIFEAIHLGLDASQIDHKLHCLDKVRRIERGVDSQDNATQLLLKCWGVYAVFEVTPDDDHMGADKFIEINRKGIPWILPVQVKSSEIEVERFRNSPTYQFLNGLVVVVKASRRTSNTYFKKKFNTEIRRIRRNFYTKPHPDFDRHLIDFYQRFIQNELHEASY